jgi:hypothetical protein
VVSLPFVKVRTRAGRLTHLAWRPPWAMALPFLPPVSATTLCGRDVNRSQPLGDAAQDLATVECRRCLCQAFDRQYHLDAPMPTHEDAPADAGRSWWLGRES